MKRLKTRKSAVVAHSAPVTLVPDRGVSAYGTGGQNPATSRCAIDGRGDLRVDGRKFESDDARFEVDDV